MHLGYLLIPGLLFLAFIGAMMSSSVHNYHKTLKGEAKKKYPKWVLTFWFWVGVCSVLSLPAGCVGYMVIDINGKKSIDFIGQINGRKMVEKIDSAPLGMPYGSHQEVYVKFTVIRPMLTTGEPQPTFSYKLNNLVMDQNNGRYIKGKMNIGFFAGHNLCPISLPDAITEVEYCDAEETNYYKLVLK